MTVRVQQPTPRATRVDPPGPGPVRPFAFPPIEQFMLPNGIPVLFARVDGLPVVTLSAVIRAGGVDEPVAQAGLASLTSDLLESGAAGSAGSDIADALEGLGIQLSVGSSWDFCHAELTGLTGRIPRGSEILADLVRAPDFPESEVERLRNEHVAHVLQSRADPRSLANEMTGRYIFSQTTPFARPLGGTAETIPSLTRGRVAGFHEANFAPARSAIVIAGAIRREEAEQMVEPFAGWAAEAGERAEFSVEPRSRERRLFIVDRPGSVQSEVRVGHVGVPRAHPDYFPIVVMNTILGGAFTSRLNMSLRERHGFTYAVSSAFSMRRAAGPFLIATAVQTEVTGSAVREIFRELTAIREAPVTDGELVDARNYVAGVFPLTLQTTSGVASRLAEMALYDLPHDYFDRYPGDVLAVSADDVERVANQYLAPHEAAVVIVGDAVRIRDELEALELGPVELVDAATIV